MADNEYDCNPQCLPCENTAQVANSVLSYRTAVLDLLCQIQASGGLSVTDTESIDLTLAANVLSADVIISPDSGNRVSVAANGVFSPASADVKIYDADDTWTKPTNAQFVEVFVCGGGGGGGSGRKGTGAASGGGGGASSAVVNFTFRASDLTNTVAITVGQGGAGGSSQTTNTTNGNPGLSGGNSRFGSYIIANGGSGGNGGTTTAISTGAAVGTNMGFISTPYAFYGASAGGGTSITGSANGFNASGSAGSFFGGRGGAGGGSITAGGVAGSGGAGIGLNTATYNTPYAGASLPGGTPGNDGTVSLALPAWVLIASGSGGAGGGASVAGNAGRGADATPYGSGGGGGGAAVDNVGNSGRGGNGANGRVVVISWCS